MFELMWMEFNAKGQIVTKRKSFKTESAFNRFVAKLFEKDNFHQILAMR